MPAIPRLDMPIRYVNGVVAVNEQGSLQDVAACVDVVLLSEPGCYDDNPDFGMRDPTFSQEPVPLSRIVSAISEWEPRAPVLATEAPDLLEEALADINLEVRVQS